MNEKIIDILVIGCGNRGEVYASYALARPDRARIVGFADPRKIRRTKFENVFKKTVDKSKIFDDWHKIVTNENKLADCVIIALPDQLHREAAIAFVNKGYHILLEKPIATTLDDCRQIKEACDKNPHVINACCHVLRYFPPCIKIKQLIDSGLIGKVININHTEPVGYWHFAHSFVRGNWHKEKDSSFSLLAKCCHDIDLIAYWMNKKCTKVFSFGSLTYFKEANAPVNSTTHCMTCPVESTCCYSAKKLYLNKTNDNMLRWPASIVLSAESENLASNLIKKSNNPDEIDDDILNRDVDELYDLVSQCLKHEKTNYGRCVYRMDNDVCDNQVVNLQFEDNAIATLTMIAFSKDICKRKTKIYGTRGELEWNDDGGKGENEIVHYDFLTDQTTRIACESSVDQVEALKKNADESASYIRLDGHGGSDYWLIHSFIDAIRKCDQSLVLTSIDDSLKSHSLVFAAESSRLSGKQVNIDEFYQTNGIKSI